MKRPFVKGNALALAILFLPSFTQQSVEAQTAGSAYTLYTMKRYKESADAFEIVLKSSAPSARLYYLAAVANVAAGRKERASQLCSYILSHFPASAEAQNAKKMSSDLAASGVSGAPAAPAASTGGELKSLPADVVASLPAHLRSQLHTPAGRQKVQAALADYNKRQAEAKAGHQQRAHGKTSAGGDDASLKAAYARRPWAKDTEFAPASLKRGDYPFTAAQIAKDGARGIDQGRNPNCWFEASMSALAELPRGQRLLASMIRYAGDGTYVVRFPGDGAEYKITEKTLDHHGVRDKAMWASLLECAQVMKFPDNRGAEGASGLESRLVVGLGCITGCQAQIMSPGNADPQELSSFIGGAVSSKNPIVCATWSDSYLAALPELVVGSHAYTIIGFDAASNMVTIRNPHGRNSDRFSLDDDPGHRKFEWKDDGIFKMHLSLFQKYFHQVCRSFI